MAYNKTEWVDGFTPVNAERLNKIENGIYETQQSIPTKVSQLKNDSNYIDESKIKNTLEETVEGNALDARQGKVLKEHIGSLHGLLTTVKTSVVAAINEIVNNVGNLSSLTTNIKTSLVDAINENTNEINVLSKQVIAYGTGIEKTTEDFVSWNDIGSGFARVNSNQPSSPSIYHQAVLSSYFDSSHGLYLSMDTQGELYCSHNKDKWKQIATTDKTEILLLNGYKVVDSGRDELVASRSGNICNITGRIMNSTTIPNKLVVGVLDMQYRPKKYRRAYVYYEPTSKVAPCEVKPNGEMVIYDNTLAINSAIRFNITYCID